MKNSFKNSAAQLQKGFTLIELLIVIGILAVLMGIVLVAVNPSRQFAQADNTKRSSDVKTILDAVSQYMADYKGKLPAGLTADGTAYDIASGAGKADICAILVPSYVAALPVDPSVNGGAQVSLSGCGSYTTGYQISVSTTNGRVSVSAPDAQAIDSNPVTISVTR